MRKEASMEGTLDTYGSPRSFEEIKQGKKSLFDAGRTMISTQKVFAHETQTPKDR